MVYLIERMLSQALIYSGTEFLTRNSVSYVKNGPPELQVVFQLCRFSQQPVLRGRIIKQPRLEIADVKKLSFQERTRLLSSVIFRHPLRHKHF